MADFTLSCLNLSMKKPIAAVFFLFLCSCQGNTGRQKPSGNKETGSSAAFAPAKTESPAADLEWRMSQGQQGGPVQIVSCTVNEKQEVELTYRNVSAERIDGLRMVLFGYDHKGARKDFAAGIPYRYVTDQQLVVPGKSASMLISLQDTTIAKVAAYTVKAHYTAGGSWENH